MRTCPRWWLTLGLLSVMGAPLLVASPLQAATVKAKPRADRPRKAPPQPRNGPVELFAVNGKETLMLRLRDDKGRPLRGVQKRFDHFLRCHHTNVQHPMNPRLVRLMYQVGRHYPGRRVEVVSGYRHPSVAKNPRSPHMQGLACDFRIAGVRNQDLRDYLRRGYEKVGVGYYPNSSFVHLDVRKDHSAFWIDYSGPGERASYSENPSADLKTGRADSYKPTKIDQSWAESADDTGGDDDGPPAGTHAAAAAIEAAKDDGKQKTEEAPVPPMAPAERGERPGAGGTRPGAGTVKDPAVGSVAKE
ncbi:MAG TPA: DUF882 domain-containing protein [Polyangia bacterium]